MVMNPGSNIVNNLMLDICAAHQQLGKQAEKLSFVSLLKDFSIEIILLRIHFFAILISHSNYRTSCPTV